MEKLHSGAKWIFRFRIYSILIFLGFLFLPFLIIFFILQKLGISLFTSFFENLNFPFFHLFLFLIFIFLLAELFSQLCYNNWKYEFTKKELKIEKGIITKTYKSIPYTRVQNVDIRRGVLARICSFSSLSIQTAGYSYSGARGIPEGYIPAVSVKRAEEIREFLMKKISGKESKL
ncbi:MAG: PH domain-containing protein [Nanoarchaeota archaeon]